METTYLIIGASIAGVSCIEGIRDGDAEGKITLISDENTLNYSRPLISYYLGGKTVEQEMSFRDKNFYDENKVQVLLNTKAEKLHVRKKEVHLSNGEKIKFQKLLIATGGKPMIPPIEGLDKVRQGVFTFTKFQDAKKLVGDIRKNNIKQAIVLGAGLIGLKCTEGLVGRGLRVRIVELADRVLANTFDRQASDILEKALGKWGCKVTKEDTVVRVESKKGRIEKVILKRRKEIPTNLLVITVGVRPNTDLAEGTGISCDRGIIVDDYLQTSVKDIYAAGDVVQGKDFLTRGNSVIAIWPVASRQGKIAGFNMTGEKVKYEGSFIMNSVELAGIPTISFGITSPSESKDFEILFKKDEDKGFYRKIILKENRVIGAIFMGKIERAGIFPGLIKDKIDVSSFKQDLLGDEFGLLPLPKEYRKHLVWGEGIEV